MLLEFVFMLLCELFRIRVAILQICEMFGHLKKFSSAPFHFLSFLTTYTFDHCLSSHRLHRHRYFSMYFLGEFEFT